MIRVCFALGTWQLITLAAGLRQAAAESPGEKNEDYLVLYETVEATDALKQAMGEVAGAVWPWKRILWAFDLMASVRRRISQRRFDFLLGQLREHLGIDAADELWFCWLTRAPEKLIMEAYPRARVVLYEDGLFSYLPVPSTPPEAPPGGTPLPARLKAGVTRYLDERRPVRRFRRHKSWLDPRHANRLSALYLLLSDVLPVPETFAHAPCHTVAERFVRETLDACAGIANVPLTPVPSPAGGRGVPISLPSPASREAAIGSTTGTPLPPAGEGTGVRGKPTVLVLGQSLSRWDVLTREQEVAVYRQVVDAILAKGYDVLWKEHPRVQEPFFPELAAKAAPGRLQEMDLPFALPVELVADRLGLSACVAGISTALLYLPRLYGIPAYTFADALAPFMTRQWAEQNDMVRSAVPPLDALPAAQGGD